MTDRLARERIGEWRGRLAGELLVPGEAGYDAARSVWNGMIDRRPALVARCTGTADVVAALRLARELGLEISVRGGGHNIAGLAVCDGGLMIDLSPMRGVVVDRRAESVWVQPGCRWRDVDRESQLFGRAVPSGVVSTTGVAGLTLGGGFGWLTRRWGLTCDHLLAAEVVTAEGEVVVADEEQHPDLFWALRGAGGNFGIVTAFRFRLRPVGPTVLAGLVAYPQGEAEQVLAGYREVTAGAPEELTALALVRFAPPAPFLPPEVHGTPIVAIGACWSGDAAAGEEHVAPLRRLGTPLGDALAPRPFGAFQQMLDATQPHGRRYYWKSDYLESLPDAALALVREHAGRMRPPHPAVIFFHLGGAARRPPADTAAVNRHAEYALNIAASWEDPAEDDERREWARDFWRAMRPHSSGRAYVNFLTEDERLDAARLREVYGESWERLVAVKGRWDPDNVFRHNHNVPPSAGRPGQPSPKLGSSSAREG